MVERDDRWWATYNAALSALVRPGEINSPVHEQCVMYANKAHTPDAPQEPPKYPVPEKGPQPLKCCWCGDPITPLAKRKCRAQAGSCEYIPLPR